MIVDVLENAARYEGLHESFKKAFDFIREAVKNEPEVGRYEIDGDKIFALVQEYEPREVAETNWEAHKKYIDIQYLYSGAEIICWDTIKNLPAGTVFDDAKDRYLYKADSFAPVPLMAGTFGIYFPEDLHRPMEAYNGISPVKKIVVKVLL